MKYKCVRLRQAPHLGYELKELAMHIRNYFFYVSNTRLSNRYWLLFSLGQLDMEGSLHCMRLLNSI